MRIIYSILLLTFISGHLFAQRSETVQTNDSTFSVIKQLKEVVITAETVSYTHLRAHET